MLETPGEILEFCQSENVRTLCKVEQKSSQYTMLNKLGV